MMFTTQSVQSVEKKTATDYLEEAKKLKEKLIEKKEQLTTTGVQPYVEDMPPKYLAIQLKVAKLLAPWQKLSEDERNKKVVVLLKKIDKLQQSTQLSEKMRMVITYVQNVAIMMASF